MANNQVEMSPWEKGIAMGVSKFFNTAFKFGLPVVGVCTAIGFFAGGPAGAVIGAIVGGAIGGAVSLVVGSIYGVNEYYRVKSSTYPIFCVKMRWVFIRKSIIGFNKIEGAHLTGLLTIAVPC